MKISKDDVMKFIKDNLKYIAIVVLLLVVIIVLALSQGKSNNNTGQSGEIVVVDQNGKKVDGYKIDAYPDVNKLVNSYFTAAAAGDIETLKTIISPFDENQQNLIKQLSEHIESYSNIKCHTKTGPIKDSYVVSVYHDTKFVGIDTFAPGLTTLYIHKNDAGALYIDNRPEVELEPDVVAFNQTFKSSSDVIELKNLVDSKAQEALSKDEKLKSFVEGTYQQIYVNFYAAIENGNKEEQNPTTEAPENQSEENQSEESPSQGTNKTMYANDMVNIRKEPNTSAEIMGMTDFGKTYTVVEELDSGWSKITVGEVFGYVKSEFLSANAPEAESGSNEGESTNTGTSKVEAGDSIYLLTTINVRSAKDTNSDKLGVAYEGETIQVTEVYSDGWSKINWKGKVGYVKTEFLQEK